MNGPLRPYTRYLCSDCRAEVWTGAYVEQSPTDARCSACGGWLVEFDVPTCPHRKCRRKMKPTNQAGVFTCPNVHKPRSVQLRDPKLPYKPAPLPYLALTGDMGDPAYFAPDGVS